MDYRKEEILEQLDRIISDKAFSRSKVNVRLLRFLVESTLADKDVKEVTIGTELFSTKYDPVKWDNKVRVYVYHLRKKLDEYYQSANSNEIVFQIAKGQYKVQFESYRATQTHDAEKNISLAKWIYGAIAMVVLAIAIFFVTKPSIDDFWKGLMNNGMSTTVVFGDYFTIEGPTLTSTKGIIRDYEINSADELEDYLLHNPELKDKLYPSQHHYFNWAAPYCSKEIAQFWAKYDYPFDIVQISEWSVSQLDNQNLVYFGQSKTMGVLQNILKEKFPQYNYRSQVLERTDPVTKKKVTYRDIITQDNKNTDYTIVAKISTPTGNEMRFFLSDQDCGAISALDYFTQKDSLAAFYQRHELEADDDFIALFKVTGWLRKSYDMEFVLLDRE
ncbi:hypothetical protein [Reichenbachiella versicolor]|uniref:hypothetical protein n=1 Tax=Reichenbachiella versicolor TaxID=1821036 RepID=UPI000D6E5747|nr:hypothetical protein [Reichenbachiella versicolor]